MADLALFSWMIFLPLGGALALIFFPARAERAIKWFSLAVTLAALLLSIELLDEYLSRKTAGGTPLVTASLQDRAAALAPSGGSADLVVRLPWVPRWHIQYFLGADGIGIALVLLTTVVSTLAMIASWSIATKVKGYCMLFLVLETGMIGVFLALDLFLFYIFWELILLPMYFLIAIWGGARREYAAMKFFLYTLFGSVLILIAMLGFYFYPTPGGPLRSFDILRLQALAEAGHTFTRGFQLTMFVLLWIGFAIKLPVFPFHTWLPDAHVEAPTPISMILAGVLLKMGGYGMIRIAYPLCPTAAVVLAVPLAVLGVWNILYGALAAMAQTDFKRLVAYSSVSHMGYVILGLAIWNSADWRYWAGGVTAAMFEMIAHGIYSPGMFFLVGVIYERAHHRDLNRFGGLYNQMPIYGGMAVAIFMCAMGLPGMCGFVGEAFVVMNTMRFAPTGFPVGAILAAVAAATVVVTAGYILWTLQRVFAGHNDAYRGTPDLSRREILGVAPLVVLAIALGVWPRLVTDWMSPSVNGFVVGMVRSQQAPKGPRVAHRHEDWGVARAGARSPAGRVKPDPAPWRGLSRSSGANNHHGAT